MNPTPAAKPAHALFIQCARMGDLIQTVPIFRALKRRRPRCKISLVFDRRYEALVREFPEVDTPWPLDVSEFWDSPAEQILNAARFREAVRWLRPLRETTFDMVCNLNYTPSGAILASIAKGRERRGFWYDPSTHRILHQGWFTYLLALTRHRRLNGFNLTEIFMRGAGFAPEPRDLYPARVPRRASGRIGIQVGASDNRKRWPNASFAALIKLIHEHTPYRVTLFGSPAERGAAENIRSLVPNLERVDLNTETPAHLLGQALEELDLLLTPDTGPMHVAAWSGVPTLALFTGSSYYVETAPWTENAVILQASTPFNPCQDGETCCRDFSCHAALSPEWVFGVLRGQIESAQNGRDYSGLAAECTLQPEAAIAVPAWKDGTLGYATGGAEQEIIERDFYKAFWVSILGPEGTPLPHSIEGPRPGVEALQTAQLLFSSLSSLESTGKPEERNARLRRSLTDLKSRFPELALMFEYYGLTPPPATGTPGGPRGQEAAPRPVASGGARSTESQEAADGHV
ncbi:MAG: glycosyltransferase family 9 protein [Nitrospirae bacterium]|nr:glycosyltransferase family 9 protein [Nitrospirota bacterium]